MPAILDKQQLSADVFMLRVEAPLIAREREPGQFVIVQTDADFGERIPLTIADADTDSITLIVQRVGRSTRELCAMDVGADIPVLLGPLGMPTHIEHVGTAVCVGGGIGVAPLHPIVKGLKLAGNRIITILGARTRELILWEDRMRELSDELIVCTDDGSHGRKALVTEPLEEVCRRDPPPDLAVAIGPAIMMKFCAETTRPFGVHTLVSLNTVMVDGTGMCGGCRVTVDGKPKFVCIDGPEFDGHLVDFDEMMARQRSYVDQERRWLAETPPEPEDHTCHLDAAADELANHS